MNDLPKEVSVADTGASSAAVRFIRQMNNARILDGSLTDFIAWALDDVADDPLHCQE